MYDEIEPKFKVLPSFQRSEYAGDYMLQGYIVNAPEKQVRLRLVNGKALITIKGKRVEETRPEVNLNVSNVKDALKAFELFCEDTPIEKIRYHVKYEGNIWEVDVFMGKNEGLVIAEIELDYKGQPFKKPEWLGEEVTYDERYYNAYISKNPYCNWKNEVEG